MPAISVINYKGSKVTELMCYHIPQAIYESVNYSVRIDKMVIPSSSTTYSDNLIDARCRFVADSVPLLLEESLDTISSIACLVVVLNILVQMI